MNVAPCSFFFFLLRRGPVPSLFGRNKLYRPPFLSRVKNVGAGMSLLWPFPPYGNQEIYVANFFPSSTHRAFRKKLRSTLPRGNTPLSETNVPGFPFFLTPPGWRWSLVLPFHFDHDGNRTFSSQCAPPKLERKTSADFSSVVW